MNFFVALWGECFILSDWIIWNAPKIHKKTIVRKSQSIEPDSYTKKNRFTITIS